MTDIRAVLDERLEQPEVRVALQIGAAVLAALVLFDRVVPVPNAVLFIGVVNGAISALIAMGIVLVYRANRVVNFAAGELGAVAGLLAALLQAGPGWGYVASVTGGLVAALAVGALVEILVIRRFATAPRLVLTVATIGVAQLLIFAELFLPDLFGEALAIFEVAQPFEASFTWSPVIFEGGHVVALVTVVAIAAGLTVFLRRSPYGIAIRATAESADRAAQLGVPTRRVGTLVWVLAAGLAAVASLLRGPLVGVPLGTVLGPALLLRAMAAAVLGRMESLPRAFAAAVALGVVEQAVVWRTGDAVVVDAVLFGVIVVALLVQRAGRRRADEAEASSWDLVAAVRGISPALRSAPAVRALGAGAAAVGLLVVLVAPNLLSPSRVNLLAAGMIVAMILLSLTVLTGWAGEISLGQMAIVGIGAAVAAKLATLGWDFFACLAGSGAAGVVAALVIGVPALRVRGPFLAVASFAFALATSSYFLNQSHFPSLIVEERVVRPEILGKFDLEHEHAFFYVVLVLLVTTVLSLRSLRNSRTGRVLLAARDNPSAAQAYGVSVLRARLTGFAVSGMVAAVAGGALMFHQHALGVNQYRPERSLEMFSLAVFGGVGSLAGAVAAATYHTVLTYFVGSQVAIVFVTAAGMLGILVFLPGGLAQALVTLRDAVLRRVAPADPPPPATQVAPAVPAPAPAPDALLSVRDLDVAYGRLQVLFGVALDVHPGEVVALLGTNGAGKSTLLRSIVGSVPQRGGTVRFAGAPLRPSTPADAARRGIALVPGGRGVFPGLTVQEHLFLAGWLVRDDRQRVEAATAEALRRFPALAGRLDQRAGSLSGGEQQMLLLAQAVVLQPELLLIDELSLGLAPTIVRDLSAAVGELARDGTTILLVEQSVDLAVTLAERALFMEKGEVRYDGPTRALRDRPDLARSVFLRGAPATVHAIAAPEPTSEEAVLRVAGLSVRFGGVLAVDDVGFDVAPGRIVGMIGANGAGKTTIFDAVSGFVPPDSGQVCLDGVDVTTWSPDARARAGLGRSFQAARLFPSLTVREAVAVAMERHVRHRSALAAMVAAPPQRESEEQVQGEVDELLASLHLEAFSDVAISELSTGTRRIVDLAAALAHRPSVLLLDEPSAGIAQRETEQLAPLLLAVRERTGAAMLVIEHDVPLLVTVADELVALDAGRVIAHGAPAEVLSSREVVRRYLGVGRGRRRRAEPLRAAR